MSAFQVSWIVFILLILILILAERLIKVNFLNSPRKVCYKLIEVEYLDSLLSEFHSSYLLYFCHSSAELLL